MTNDSLKSSLLDRLTRPEESPATPGFSKAFTALKDSILHDLVDLLNARSRCTQWPDKYSDLESTLLNYGVPDFAGRDFASDADREYLKEAVRVAITKFEPRLKNTRVEVDSAENASDGRVRMEIIAGLSTEPDDQFSFGVDLIERNGEFQAEAGS